MTNFVVVCFVQLKLGAAVANLIRTVATINSCSVHLLMSAQILDFTHHMRKYVLCS